MAMNRFQRVALLLIACAASAPAVQAAGSYDNCTGYVDSLPATLATQGTWCLRHDLSSAMVSGEAITIGANNITLDCNGFKLGGLAAGPDTTTIGIFAANRTNITVRDCAIRGFYGGIYLNGGRGHRVEDNRLDQHRGFGITVTGDGGSLVQRNRIYDTGGAGSANTEALYAHADVIDNTVAGVFAVAPDTFPVGIRALGAGNRVRGNQVRSLLVQGNGNATGIWAYDTHQSVTDNHVTNVPSTAGWGIAGSGVASTFCGNNHVQGFATPFVICHDVGGNASQP